jgi:hypothetical protein
MKNEREKSDPSIVAQMSATNLGNQGRSRRSQGKGPRETRESNTRAGHRAGQACPRGSNVYEK